MLVREEMYIEEMWNTRERGIKRGMKQLLVLHAERRNQGKEQLRAPQPSNTEDVT